MSVDETGGVPRLKEAELGKQTLEDSGRFGRMEVERTLDELLANNEDVRRP